MNAIFHFLLVFFSVFILLLLTRSEKLIGFGNKQGCCNHVQDPPPPINLVRSIVKISNSNFADILYHLHVLVILAMFLLAM